MITKLLKMPKSASAALDYNEEKLFLGEAEIVAIRNIGGNSMFAVRMAMEARENNPAIHAGVRKMAIHLTVNPGEDDNTSLAASLMYIDDMMQNLELSEQPYVVFMHHDIERIHYHVVGSRVMSDGHIIRDSHIGRKIKALQEQLAPIYDYTVGRADEDLILEPTPVKRGMKNLIAQIRANVKAAVSFIHSGETQLRAVLKAYNVRMKRGTVKDKQGNGHPYVSFCGVDNNEKPVMRPIKGGDLLGEAFDTYYAKNHITKQKTPSPVTISLIKDELSKSDGLADFRRRLKRDHIGLYLSKSSGEEAKKVKDIKDAVFVDMLEQQCLSLKDCNIALDAIIRLARIDEERENRNKRIKEKRRDKAERTHGISKKQEDVETVKRLPKL